MAARASRPWRRAALFALGAHAILFALAIRSVRTLGPPPEPQAIGLQLIQVQPPPPEPKHRTPARPAVPRAAAAPAPLAPAAVEPATPAAIPAPATPGDGDTAGRVRTMLRGSSGCSSAAFLKLSAAERRRCEQWRAAGIDPNLQIPAPIDPAKKSWFDASLEYRQNGRFMPVGPPGRGVQLVPGVPPGHGIHIPNSPFVVGLPGGAFNDDDAPPP